MLESILFLRGPWMMGRNALIVQNACLTKKTRSTQGHLYAHVWSCGVRKVVSSNPARGNIEDEFFIRLARFSLIWICLCFQILNLFRTLSSWWSGNYRPSAPFLYEVASHVKQLPFRPILILYVHSGSVESPFVFWTLYRDAVLQVQTEVYNTELQHK